jgi:hypothetical protein
MRTHVREHEKVAIGSTTIPTFADGGRLKSGSSARAYSALKSGNLVAFSAVVLIFSAFFGPLRSFQNFPLSERRRITGQFAAPMIRGGFAFNENGPREAGHFCRELISNLVAGTRNHQYRHSLMVPTEELLAPLLLWESPLRCSGRTDSNLRVVESQSARFFNNFNGFSDETGDSAQQVMVAVRIDHPRK